MSNLCRSFGPHVRPVACQKALVLGDSVDTIAADAAKIEGVSKVLTVTRAENTHPLAAVLAPQIAKAADGYSHVLAPSTTFGKDVAPRVAALLGVAQVSDVMSVESSHTFKRPIYAGNAIITVEANADHIAPRRRLLILPLHDRRGVERGFRLSETPTHFRERGYGTSKIPPLEIFRGIANLLRLALKKATGSIKVARLGSLSSCDVCHTPYSLIVPTHGAGGTCVFCGNHTE